MKNWVTASPANFGSAVIVAVLAVTLPFGGWREAEKDALAAPPVGERTTVAPFEVTVERAVHGVDLGGYLTESLVPDERHVVVILTLRNTTDQTLTTTDLRQFVAVRGLTAMDGDPEGEDSGPGWTQLLDVETEPGPLSGLVPGLDYQVALHRTVAAPAAELPEELTVRLSTLTYRQMSIADQYIWTDPAPAAEVVVPLEEVASP